MQRVPGSDRRSIIFVSGMALLMLLAFALRAYRLDWQSLWVDENFTVFLSSQDMASITRITSGDVHPPLYYYLVHYWSLLTGLSEFSLRFLSLAFSLLLVPLVFRAVSVLAGARVAWIASFLTAIGPFQVYYAQEARMYSLIALLSLVSTHAMVMLAGYGLGQQQDGARPKRPTLLWATLVLSSAAILYVHYFGLLFLFFQNSVVLLTRLRHKGFFWRWCLSQAAVAILFSPWAAVMARVYATNDEPWRRHIPLLPMLQEIMVNLSIGQSVEESLSLPLASGFFLALLAGMVALALKKEARHLALLLGSYLFLPVLLAYLVSFSKPVYGGSRYFLFAAPALYGLVSFGLQAARRKMLPGYLALMACLVGASAYSLASHYWNEAFAKDDYRGMARLLERRAGPGDGIVVMNGLVFDYYYKGPSPRILLPLQYPLSEAQVLDELNRFSRGKSRLWLVQWKDNVLDPDNFIKNSLEDHGQKTEGGNIRGLEYASYRLTSEAPFQVEIKHPLQASFANRVSLEGYTLSPEKATAGRAMEVVFYLKAEQPLDQDYKLSLSLRDSEGYLWAQEDKVPTGYSMSRWRAGERVQGRFTLNVPLGTPPGEYSLSVLAYSAARMEPLPVVDARNAPVGAVVQLGKVQVLRGQVPYDVASVRPARAQGQELVPGIRLLGYDLSPGEADQGGTVGLVLYWQALSRTQEDYEVSVRLRDEQGFSIQEYREKPHHGLYPTPEWEQGEVVRDVYTLALPGKAPPGKTRVEVGLIRAGSSCCLQAIELAPVLVREKARTFEAPAVEHPREEELGGKVRLLGYALSGTGQRPGDQMTLTLYWQAMADGTASYAVFTHLLDSANRVQEQHDGPPGGGTQPTSSWIAGQTVTDPHHLALKPDMPPGFYVLEIGMYDPASGQRLKLASGEDRVVLERIKVE